MANLLRNALRRKLVAAEEAGEFARADIIRARLGLPPEPAISTAEVTLEPAGDDEDWSESEVAGLDAVDFASPAARHAAEAAGMSAEMFTGQRKSSLAGFTKPDVERITAGEKERG